MKKFEVELSITQTFTTKVIIEGDFQDKNDPAIEEIAKHTADNMDHNAWNYIDTEFEINNVTLLPDFKIFAVGDDRPEYIVAKTKEEAIADHMSRIDEDYYGDEGPNVEEIPLEAKGMFETKAGYREMTFAEFLAKDFKYTGPRLICWSE
ncbi:hypothetical protein [Thermaerobacillus caldiproteolyticus]|uniref:hypothetical protein n=1 Tax=Thermaerobacillus caldiproteolyticus TaxID=247480 RepID=UPI00188A1A31|nr:hypothetical protein [Anoxybacillus caldiproteolyticus]QPA33410.1 hypothetical protein ISX45_18995 [Anoxybacillus caldiproteolyticus]